MFSESEISMLFQILMWVNYIIVCIKCCTSIRVTANENFNTDNRIGMTINDS